MQGAAEGVNDTASRRFEAPQDLGDSVVGPHRVDDERQIMGHGQPHLRLEQFKLPLLGHLGAQVQPAFADGHQPPGLARQQGLQPCQRPLRLGPHIPGMHPQTITNVMMTLGQRHHPSPVFLSHGGDDILPHPQLAPLGQQCLPIVIEHRKIEVAVGVYQFHVALTCLSYSMG
ncbi:hypothetical protein D3C72_976910 [compost metagenome]